MLTDEQRQKIEEARKELERCTASPVYFRDAEHLGEQVRVLYRATHNLLEILSEVTN